MTVGQRGLAPRLTVHDDRREHDEENTDLSVTVAFITTYSFGLVARIQPNP